MGRRLLEMSLVYALLSYIIWFFMLQICTLSLKTKLLK